MTRDRLFVRGIRTGVRRLLRLPIHSALGARADADAELDAYIEARVERLVARGMTPAEARLGGPEPSGWFGRRGARDAPLVCRAPGRPKAIPRLDGRPPAGCPLRSPRAGETPAPHRDGGALLRDRYWRERGDVQYRRSTAFGRRAACAIRLLSRGSASRSGGAMNHRPGLRIRITSISSARQPHHSSRPTHAAPAVLGAAPTKETSTSSSPPTRSCRCSARRPRVDDFQRRGRAARRGTGHRARVCVLAEPVRRTNGHRRANRSAGHNVICCWCRGAGLQRRRALTHRRLRAANDLRRSIGAQLGRYYGPASLVLGNNVGSCRAGCSAPTSRRAARRGLSQRGRREGSWERRANHRRRAPVPCSP